MSTWVFIGATLALLVILMSYWWRQRRGTNPRRVAADIPQSGSESNPDPAGRPFAVSVMPKGWQLFSAFGFMLLGVCVIARIPPTVFGGPGRRLVTILVFAVVCCLVIQLVLLGRKVVIRVTTDGLTISGRPGDVFSFRDAQLGQWRTTRGRFGPYVGRALFLTSGPHRFALGDMRNGRNHADQVPVEGPQVNHGDLDAWATKSSDFDELLTIVGSARGV
jgi:hypothetical protein